MIPNHFVTAGPNERIPNAGVNITRSTQISTSSQRASKTAFGLRLCSFARRKKLRGKNMLFGPRVHARVIDATTDRRRLWPVRVRADCAVAYTCMDGTY